MLGPPRADVGDGGAEVDLSGAAEIGLVRGQTSARYDGYDGHDGCDEGDAYDAYDGCDYDAGFIQKREWHNQMTGDFVHRNVYAVGLVVIVVVVNGQEDQCQNFE